MSNTYISPSGNPEIWGAKPKGYYTPDEWDGMHRPVPPPPLTLEEARTTALAALATRRWHAETAGIRVNGLDIPTDRESQSLITGAVAGTLIDPAQTVRWKTATRDEHGTPVFVTLTAEAIRAVALAVRAHVQLCFDCEAVKSAQVGTLESVAALEEWTVTQMGVGWPGEVPPGD